MIVVAICIATCNRPAGLKLCLEKLNNIIIDETKYSVRVIVVDNSHDGNVRILCQKMQNGLRYELNYFNEKRKGIPFARNTAIRKALAINCKYLVFIDDDEYPNNNWLNVLLSYAEKENRKLVTGPVLPRYEDCCNGDFIKAGLFERKRHATGEIVKHFATNNLVIDTKVLSAETTWFDETMDLQGGTDTDFALRLAHKGVDCVWCDEAIVYETVPAKRCTYKWLFLRAFRGGANYTIFRKKYKLCKAPIMRSALIGFFRVSLSLLYAVLSLGFIKGFFFITVRNLGLGLGLLSGICNVTYSEYAHAHENINRTQQ